PPRVRSSFPPAQRGRQAMPSGVLGGRVPDPLHREDGVPPLGTTAQLVDDRPVTCPRAAPLVDPPITGLECRIPPDLDLIGRLGLVAPDPDLLCCTRSSLRTCRRFGLGLLFRRGTCVLFGLSHGRPSPSAAGFPQLRLSWPADKPVKLSKGV